MSTPAEVDRYFDALFNGELLDEPSWPRCWTCNRSTPTSDRQTDNPLTLAVFAC